MWIPTLSDEKYITDNWLEIRFSEKCQYLPLLLILAELRSAPYFWKSSILFKCLILVTYVQEFSSSSPQLWSFLDHRRFCHLFRGSSQEHVWPSPFPILLFKCLRKENDAFLFVFFFFFSWNGDRKELNQNFVLNSSIPNSCGCMCFEPGPGRTRIFSSFLLGYTCSFPFLCFVGSFWYPSLSCLHPDPSLPWVWVTRAIRLPASTYSVPQLLG